MCLELEAINSGACDDAILVYFKNYKTNEQFINYTVANGYLITPEQPLLLKFYNEGALVADAAISFPEKFLDYLLDLCPNCRSSSVPNILDELEEQERLDILYSNLFDLFYAGAENAGYSLNEFAFDEVSNRFVDLAIHDPKDDPQDLSYCT